MHNMAFMFTFNNTMVEWISHHIDFCTAIQKRGNLELTSVLFMVLGGHLRAFLSTTPIRLDYHTWEG